MELSEVTVEALTAIIQHPHTSKFRLYISRAAANVLYKFQKIIDMEIESGSLNKVLFIS